MQITTLPVNKVIITDYKKISLWRSRRHCVRVENIKIRIDNCRLIFSFSSANTDFIGIYPLIARPVCNTKSTKSNNHAHINLCIYKYLLV